MTQRRKFIAGNWKMNERRASAVELAGAIAQGVGAATTVDVAVCPPACYLEAVHSALGSSAVGLGAQNCHHEAKGAYTGELSTAMLLDVGCKYVILGHSERRQYFKESSADVNRKVVAALAAGLTPIVCLGESKDDRAAGRTLAVVGEQFAGSLADLPVEQASRIVLAYEPVWAIGTGVVATPGQAEEVHAALRKLLESRYSAQVAAAVRIQYGGSVTDENAATLFSQPNIDGALVGGASLKAASFLKIVEQASKSNS
jgi:triosephosphate isomerase